MLCVFHYNLKIGQKILHASQGFCEDWMTQCMWTIISVRSGGYPRLSASQTQEMESPWQKNHFHQGAVCREEILAPPRKLVVRAVWTWNKLSHGVKSSLVVKACKERLGQLQRRLLHEGLEPEGLLGTVPLWCDSARAKLYITGLCKGGTQFRGRGKAGGEARCQPSPQ